MSAAPLKPARERGRLAPIKFAHAVLRTRQFQTMVNWYRTVLEADIQFENDFLAFLTYDDEHHRIAIIARPGIAERPPNSVGLDHLAYSYADLGELVATYERLKAAGIMPERTINHGPTTSMYYKDPDDNRVELQIDNFDTAEECNAYFYGEDFSSNPIGVLFDPEELTAKYHGGVAAADLKKRGYLKLPEESISGQPAR
jgi:catechol 2,3-dioxygenase-like lactoylglutathione lyase family enzyme